MNKLIFIFVAIFALYSCSDSNKQHASLITIDAPVKYNMYGSSNHTTPKMKIDNLGIIEDSVTNQFKTNLINKEFDYTDDLLNLYGESLKNTPKDEAEYYSEIAKRSAIKELLGRSVILVIISESLIEDISPQNIMHLMKNNPQVISYNIYDGSTILANIEINESM